jgi:Protein of unknown function (DUF2845)
VTCGTKGKRIVLLRLGKKESNGLRCSCPSGFAATHGEMTMIKRHLGIVLTLFTLTLGMGGLMDVRAGETDSIMCDNGVVAIGDFFQTVQDKCGEPDKKEGKFWRYNFGPSLPVYTIEFDENGNAIRIMEDQGSSQ